MTLLENIPGATPIEDDSGLIPQHITSRTELNEWEAANILKAERKYLSGAKHQNIDVAWLKKLHQEMFGETWTWAGEFRRKNFNLGVDWQNIPEQIKLLVDDIAYWGKTTILDVLEQSIRLHHRLVKIHPFINGNGRHARLASDIYLYYHNNKLPVWPGEKMIKESDIRKKYITALQAADKGDYQLLKTFTSKLIG